MPSEPLCNVCYHLIGGRDLMHSLKNHDGDVCTRCHARREKGLWNRTSALVQMHDAMTTAELARCLCDHCGRSPMKPLPKVGDVCEKCGAVYVQNLTIGTGHIALPESLATSKDVTFFIPGWRRPTAIEVMGEAVDDDAL